MTGQYVPGQGRKEQKKGMHVSLKHCNNGSFEKNTGLAWNLQFNRYKNCRKQAQEGKNSQEGIRHEKQYFIIEHTERSIIFFSGGKQPVSSKTATGESAAISVRTIHF